MSFQSGGMRVLTEETVKRNLDGLFRVAAAIMGSKAEAEDIVQDAFLKLIDKQPHFESAEHEAAWLFRVTINLCKNRLRSHWWKKTVPLLDTYPAQCDEQLDIVQAVLSLPAKYRTVIHLFYYEGHSTKEIAALTEQNEPAVRKLAPNATKTFFLLKQAFQRRDYFVGFYFFIY